MAKAFAQATATFDQIELQGADGSWRRDDVGVSMESDGRTPHHPGGVVESGGKLVVTGGGDIGPATVEGGLRADLLLIGGAVGLIPIFVAAATFLTTRNRPEPTGPSPTEHPREPAGSGPAAVSRPARLLAARAVVVGVVGFAAGLVIVLVVVPYLLATAGLAPWLLVITPAAGFAITQSIPTFAHVDVDPSLLGGYYPLPPWAGLTVTCGYAAVTLGVAIAVSRGDVPLHGSLPLAR
ncbi:hypothetical protein [Nonomuraea sp. NPDC001023]|uniref:hypothetical protein n=1 Tax=unclassified Nonomuraea TaxID=2593643 RepID=UPI0033312F26